MDTVYACAGGTATLEIKNLQVPNQPVSFLWSSGGTTQSITRQFTAVGEETYVVTLTDGKKCTSVDSIKVMWVFVPTVVFQPDRDTICQADSISLSPIVSNDVVGYNWSTGATTTSIEIVGLPNNVSQEYSVTVNNQAGCVASDTITVQHVPAPDVNLGPDQLECDGQPVVVDAGSFAAYPYQPVTFAWYNFRTQGTGNQQTYTVPGSELGHTKLKVTVAAQVSSNRVCKDIDEINVYISDLAMTSVTHEITCHGSDDGRIDLNIADGIMPYLFNWTGPGGFTSTAEDLTGLAPGTYNLTVTDSIGCNKNLQPAPSIIEPAPVGFAQVVVVQDSCGFGTGSISVAGHGGRPFTATPPHYNFQWNTGATTPAIGSLSPGTFNVTITDSLNCLKDTLITVTGPTDTLSVILDTTAISCFGANDGKVKANPMGGTPPYTYKWSKNFNPIAGSTNEITGLGLDRFKRSLNTIIDHCHNTRAEFH